eukprot:Ihof_evm1s1295 gene=Ihof_evmTU1s1295
MTSNQQDIQKSHEAAHSEFCGAVLSDCVANDCPELAGLYLALRLSLLTIGCKPSPTAYWSLRLAVHYSHGLAAIGLKTLVQENFLNSIGARLQETMTKWAEKEENRGLLCDYLLYGRVPRDRIQLLLLGQYLIHQGLPLNLDVATPLLTFKNLVQ